MKSLESETRDQIVQKQRITLLELLDRLLDKGVMVKGEILLSVAEIDLVYLNVGLLLSSVKTVENAAKSNRGTATSISRQALSQWEELSLEDERGDVVSPLASKETSPEGSNSGETIARTLPSAIDHGIKQCFEPRADIDPKNVERGLAKLVLTLVDLIRKLMEKQAIRRIENEQLDAREAENVGTAFLLLDEKMEQLKKVFDLTDEDLNLDLGPLGDLL
jgi:hypothetical protein